MPHPETPDSRHSLTVTLGRTEGGGLRAELPGDPADVTEAPTVKELLERLEPKLVALVMKGAPVTPVPDDEEGSAIREIEKGALRGDALRTLAERYPAPQTWYDEPAWSDDPQ